MRTLVCMLGVTVAAGTASAQVVTTPLVSSSPHVGTLFQPPGDTDGIDVVDAPFWDFWTFSANAGDNIDIEVNRLEAGLDPVSSVLLGDANGLAFGSLTGTTIFDWSGPGLGAVLATGDDDDPDAFGGPFGDPHYQFVAPSSGTYTIAVANFLSTLPFPADGYDYEIIVTGSTVPGPATAALLGLAGLLAGGRRRRA